MRIGAIVFMCYDFDKMLAFWQREAEVERLVIIGATRYPWRYRAGADFIVLEDPEGYLFCVVQVSSET